ASLVGQHQRLAGAGLQLLDVGELTAETHFDLRLVTGDLCGLVGQRLVLWMRILDGPRVLQIRIGHRGDLRGERGNQIVPALGEWVGHMDIPVFLVENRSGVLADPARRLPCGADRTAGRARGSSHGRTGQAAHTPTLRRSITRASSPSTCSNAFSPAATMASGLTAAAIPSPMAMAEPTSNNSSET